MRIMTRLLMMFAGATLVTFVFVASIFAAASSRSVDLPCTGNYCRFDYIVESRDFSPFDSTLETFTSVKFSFDVGDADQDNPVADNKP